MREDGGLSTSVMSVPSSVSATESWLSRAVGPTESAKMTSFLDELEAPGFSAGRSCRVAWCQRLVAGSQLAILALAL